MWEQGLQIRIDKVVVWGGGFSPPWEGDSEGDGGTATSKLCSEEQRVRGSPQTRRPQIRQWCFRLERVEKG